MNANFHNVVGTQSIQQYIYDRNGKRLSRTNLIDAAFSESYSYDNLNQLIGFTRGEHSRSWDYDAQGNWQSVVTDGSVQTRTHNAQNEITGISGAVLPTYDANGNLTRDEVGRQFVYDAWNRLVEVRDGSGETVKRYAYDGLHRRISEAAGGVTTDFYYSDQWQVLEEQVGGQTTVQYVWSPVYVDALILRDRDSDGDGTLDERLWVVQDANFNVTAVVDDSGEVVERYVYDPFGQATVLDASWNVVAASAFAWVYLHQGGRYDVTSGLYHFRFRDYSPTLGRWTSLDPLGFDAGDPNLYRFVFNVPTVFTDPSGQAIFIPLLIIGGAALLGVAGTAGYTAYESYRTTGTAFNGEIWGAAGEGIVFVGPRVIVNSAFDAVASNAGLGSFDQLELWPVPPEDRNAYELGYPGSRLLWELEVALLTRKLPTKLQPYALAWDATQNGVLVSRGLLDVPQITRHGGGPLRLKRSEGMLLHGPTWTNSTDVILGLFGVGSNTILLRTHPATAPTARGPVHIDIGGEGRYPGAININPNTTTSTTGAPGRPIPNLVQALGERLPFADESVDIITLENAPIWQATISEIARVIKPGGYIRLVGPASPEVLAAHQRIAEAVGGRVFQTRIKVRSDVGEVVYTNIIVPARR